MNDLESVTFENCYDQEYMPGYPADLPGDMATFYVSNGSLTLSYFSARANARDINRFDESDGRPGNHIASAEFLPEHNLVFFRRAKVEGLVFRLKPEDVHRVLKALVPMLERSGLSMDISIQEAIQKEEEKIIQLHKSVQFAMAFGKMLGGTVRCVTEDLFGVACQSIYLCKIWHQPGTTWATRAFTIASIFAGAAGSSMGPIMESCKVRRLRRQATRDADYFGYDRVPAEPAEPQGGGAAPAAGRPTGGAPREQGKEYLDLQLSDQHTHGEFLRHLRESIERDLVHVTSDGKRWRLVQRGSLKDAPSDPADLLAEFKALGVPCTLCFEREVPRASDVTKMDRVAEIANMSIRRFLSDGDVPKGRVAHRLLLIAASMYWATMLLIYFAADIPCGQGAPKWAWMAFLCMSVVSHVAEFWALVHCKRGFFILSDFEPALFIGVCFGNLGRFDSFSDVTTSVAIENCAAEDPEFFSWFSIHGHVVQLPADLGTLVRIGLLMIVVFQLVPALVFLISKRLIPVALKLNEFGIIIAAMETELNDDEMEVQKTFVH